MEGLATIYIFMIVFLCGCIAYYGHSDIDTNYSTDKSEAMTKHNYEIYRMKIKSFDPVSKQATAELISANNLNINGTLKEKNEYRQQQTLLIGKDYKLCLLACKRRPEIDKEYKFSGSWILGELRVTNFL